MPFALVSLQNLVQLEKLPHSMNLGLRHLCCTAALPLVPCCKALLGHSRQLLPRLGSKAGFLCYILLLHARRRTDMEVTIRSRHYSEQKSKGIPAHVLLY